MLTFSVMPIIESLNGKYFGNHISDLYRLLLVALIIVYLVMDTLKYNFMPQVFKTVIIISIFIGLNFFQYLLLHGQLSILSSDFKTTARILLCPIYFCFFYVSIKRKDLSRQTLIRLLYTYSILYSALIVIPYWLGKGYVTYDTAKNSFLGSEGIGFKGYFIETNSLVALLIGSMFVIGESLMVKVNQLNLKAIIINAVVLGSIVFSLVLISTKTGIIVAVVYLIIIFYRILICQSIKKNYRVLFFSILMLTTPFFVLSLKTSVSDLVGRWKYFSNTFNGDLLKLITSSRSTYFINSASDASKSDNFITLSIIGGGYSLDFVKPYEIFKRDVIEMDLLDLYFAYGFVGFIGYLNYFKNSLVNFILSDKSGVKYMLAALLIYSLFAGHVIFNPMTATFLSICFAYYIKADLRNINFESR